ncbi:MAG: mitochondrial fission ELM1 family protein [Dokdonella sp.]
MCHAKRGTRVGDAGEQAMTEKETCWAISDGAAGNERQVLALARALGHVPRVLRVSLREPWAMLAPRFTLAARSAIREQDGGDISPPWPSLAIGCGRRAALLTRLLRESSDGRTTTIQILDPRISSSRFDYVITPQHDAMPGENVIRTIGALNPVDDAWLFQARANHAHFADFAGSRHGVLIGASNRAQRIDAEYCKGLIEQCRAMHANEGGSFLVTVSRRTSPDVSDFLRSAFAALPGMFWAGPDDGDNPYAGILAWADRLIVTPDSVNMISEACATGRPVWTYAPKPIIGKLAGFHAELIAAGYLRPLGDTHPRPAIAPLRETAAVAELIQNRRRIAAEKAVRMYR